MISAERMKSVFTAPATLLASRCAASPLAGGKAEWLQAAGPVHRRAETFLRTGSLLTGSNMYLKLDNIQDRLLLRERTTATLILSAEDGVAGRPPAEQSLRAFLAATGPVDAASRRPWIDWLHTMSDQAALVRPFLKWDNQPASIPAVMTLAPVA